MGQRESLGRDFKSYQYQALPMLPVSKVVLNFVRACEGIQGRLAHGDPLTPEEQDIIEASANELLDKLTPA